MWYVIQVRTGTEERIAAQCRRNIPEDVLERCFIPYYEERKRRRGEWVTEKRVLFPGYVFLVSGQIEEVYAGLKTVIGLTRLLGAGGEVLSLSDEEIAVLRRLGGEEQVAEMSEGIIAGGRVIVRSGPLMGMEGTIRKIDRHKRKAWLELSLFGRVQSVQMGLEIVEKLP